MRALDLVIYVSQWQNEWDKSGRRMPVDTEANPASEVCHLALAPIELLLKDNQLDLF